MEKYFHVQGLQVYDRLWSIAVLAHYQFETIHPFGDGNGRVGRLLLALMTEDTLRPYRSRGSTMSEYYESKREMSTRRGCST